MASAPLDHPVVVGAFGQPVFHGAGIAGPLQQGGDFLLQRFAFYLGDALPPQQAYHYLRLPGRRGQGMFLRPALPQALGPKQDEGILVIFFPQVGRGIGQAQQGQRPKSSTIPVRQGEGGGAGLHKGQVLPVAEITVLAVPHPVEKHRTVQRRGKAHFLAEAEKTGIVQNHQGRLHQPAVLDDGGLLPASAPSPPSACKASLWASAGSRTAACCFS